MRAILTAAVMMTLVLGSADAQETVLARTDSAAGAARHLDQPAVRSVRSFSWPRFVGGFVASLATHEAAHIAVSLIVGANPSIGFNSGRPVMHSGIDAIAHPDQQFAFSASGMVVQLLINEVILDWPRPDRGIAGEFERGVLAGGVGTVLFYFTIGRGSGVSDVQWMDDTSGLSKWSLMAIFGGVAALDVARVLLDRRYAHFFAFPDGTGRLHLGLTMSR